MKHFDFLPTPIFRWMLNFPLASRLQFASIQDKLPETAYLPISSLHWWAFWLYNVYKCASKKAVSTWQCALNSK